MFIQLIHEGPMYGRTTKDQPFMNVTKSSFDFWTQELVNAYINDLKSAETGSTNDKNFVRLIHDGPVCGGITENQPGINITQSHFDVWAQTLLNAYIDDFKIFENSKAPAQQSLESAVPCCKTCAYCYKNHNDEDNSDDFICGVIENGERADYAYLNTGTKITLRNQTYMVISSSKHDQRAHTRCRHYEKETRNTID